VREIPYTRVGELEQIATRTSFVRVALAVTLLALVVATAAAARHPHTGAQPFLPPRSGGVVALDLSASITSDTYSRIRATLQQLVARGGRYGLVVFSSDAYVALPPGTPASALEPLIRYFTLPKVAHGEQPSFPANPWTSTFTSGTRISAGLALARQLEQSNGARRPAVVLVSDLADDPSDLQRLNAVLGEYAADRIRLRVIALNAAPTDEARFAGLIGSAAAIIPAGLSGNNTTTAGPPHSSFPTWLVILTIAVSLVLGINELRTVRLRWGDAPTEAKG